VISVAKNVRTKIGLTQVQLAEKLDVEPNTLARWERDELEPAHPKMLWLALQYIRQQYIRPELAAELAERHAKLMKSLDKK
jgi:transcriptional regulator with XRE-family HTH domain